MKKTIYYICNEINQIKQFEKASQFQFKEGNKPTQKYGWLKKISSKGYVYISKSFDNSKRTDLNFSLINKKYRIKITDAYIKHTSHSFSNNSDSYRYEIKLNSFKSYNLRLATKYYCKQIIRIDKDDFLRSLYDSSYIADDNIHSRGLIKIRISTNLAFDAFIKSYNKSHYLMIQSNELLNPEVFKEYCWSIAVSLGFVMNYLMQNEAYYFYYKKNDLKRFSAFEYRQLRDSIKSIYDPINDNPYAWIKNSLTAKKFASKLAKITQDQFSQLCRLVHENIQLKGTILLIIESTTRSLLLMPAGYSVALEAFAEYFYNQNQKALKPITDKIISQKIRQELKSVLNSYKSNLHSDGFKIIETKLNDLNSPTNSEKLKAPFKILNIDLTDIDIQVLKHRNDFLHGNVGLDHNYSKYNMDSFEISLRMLTLLNAIILKMIGYNGFIINHVKTQEKGIGKKINEEVYRKI